MSPSVHGFSSTLLTPSQRTDLGEIANRWRSPSAVLDSVDKPLVESVLAEVYSAAALAPPTEFTWRESPLAGARLVMETSSLQGWGAGVARILAEDRFDAIWNDACSQLGISAAEEVRSLVDREVWLPERDKPWQVQEEEIDRSTGSSIEHWGSALITGHFSQYLSAWCECLASLGIDSAADWPLAGLGETGCWAWTYENAALISPQPHPGAVHSSSTTPTGENPARLTGLQRR